MSGWVVLMIVMGAVALLCALVWWSSGRAKPLRRGHVDHTNAHLHQVQSRARNSLGGVHGGGGQGS